MKTIKSTIIWTTLFFVALTLLTMKNESDFDGFDQYGFPFIFYDHFEGKCDDCSGTFGFKPLYLLLDILFTLALGLSASIIRRQFVRKSNRKD